MPIQGRIVPCEVDDAVEFLGRIEGIKSLSKDDIRHMAMLTQKQHWPANVEIFKEMDEPDAMYFIESGQVGIWRDGKQIMALGSRAIFGEMGILDDLPRRATIITLTDTLCYVLPAKMIQELVEEHESLASYFNDLINSRLRQSQD